MTFILRWPAILVLLALVLLSFLGAVAGAGALTGFDTGLTPVQDAQVAAVEAGAAQATWLDVGLWAGAGIFFLISAIRLMRRTQAFWTWLLGFALYGANWALAQSEGLAATVQSIDPNVYMQPQVVASDLASTEAQVGILGIILIVGLIVFIVDAADRAYWDKQGA